MDKAPEIKKNKKKYTIGFIFFILLIVLTFYTLLKDQNFSTIKETLSMAAWRYLVLAVVVMFGYFLIKSMAAKTILKNFGYQVRLKNCLKYTFIDFYFSAITPGASGGQPAALFYMNKDDIEIGMASISIIFFNMTYHIALLLLGGVLLLIGRPAIVGEIKIFLIYGSICHFGMMLVFLATVFFPRILVVIGNAVILLLNKIRIIKNVDVAKEKYLAQVEEYAKGARIIREKPMMIIKILPFALGHMVCSFAVSFLVYRALGLTTLGFFDILTLQTLVIIATDSIPLPGAVGVTEGVFMIVYRSVYTSTMIVPAVMLTRLISFYFYVLFSGVVTGGAHISLMRRKLKTDITPAVRADLLGVKRSE